MISVGCLTVCQDGCYETWGSFPRQLRAPQTGAAGISCSLPVLPVNPFQQVETDLT